MKNANLEATRNDRSMNLRKNSQIQTEKNAIWAIQERISMDWEALFYCIYPKIKNSQSFNLQFFSRIISADLALRR